VLITIQLILCPMETTKVVGVLALLALVASVGIGVMVWAYLGSGSVSVLFTEVNPVPPSLPDASQPAFQTGIRAYIRGHYRRAIVSFNRVIEQQPRCAAAQHNLGLAYANLRQDDRATLHLLKAAQLYAEQRNPVGVVFVKSHLQTLQLRA
jgi:tetratricopeptide (TPR) repeat protein